MDNLNSILNSSAYFNIKDENFKSDKIKNKAKGLSKNSTEEELRSAVKSFESYFVEQVLKEIHKSTKMFNDKGNTPVSQMKDLFMDNLYRDMATKIVDKTGKRYTDSLIDQMKRTYGIKDGVNKSKSKKNAKIEDNIKGHLETISKKNNKSENNLNGTN